MSPVWNPWTCLAPLGLLRADLHLRREPDPVAVISNGTTSVTLSGSGVESPTQAASHQWVLSNSRTVRLNFVSPPEPHSTGNPNVLSRPNKAHLVALTAAASLSGALAW